MNTNINLTLKSVTLHGISLLLLSLSCAASSAARSNKVRSVAISPDGTLVAAEFDNGSGSFIYIIRVNTGKATRLTDNASGEESSPSFSADGKRIIFGYWPGAQSHAHIVLANVDGSGLKSIPSEQFDDLSPALTPNGKTVVFARAGFYGHYSPLAAPHSHAWRIYAGELDGTNVRELTNDSFYMVSPVSISHNGKNVVLVTERIDSAQRIEIYSLDQPGHSTLSIQPHVPKSDRRTPLYECPNLLPDEKHILFMAASGMFRYSYDVYELDLTAGSLLKLTNRNGYATGLKVSRDGKTAVFLRWQSDKSQIYLLDVNNYKVTHLSVSGLN